MLQQAMKVDCGTGRIGEEGRAIQEDGTNSAMVVEMVSFFSQEELDSLVSDQGNL